MLDFVHPLPGRSPSHGRAALFPLLAAATLLHSSPVAAQTASPPPAPTASPAASTAGGEFLPPKVLKRVPPAYPDLAQMNRVEGVVRVKFFIDENGQITNILAVKSSRSVLLDNVVRNHDLREWTFQPATLDGKPVPGTLEQEFEFHLNRDEERAVGLRRMALSLTPPGTPDAPYPREALPSRAAGSCTINVKWTKAGLVDMIYLSKSSGSNILDLKALRFAYEHWHVDPKSVTDQEFSKTMTFTPPEGAAASPSTPPPLPTASPSAH